MLLLACTFELYTGKEDPDDGDGLAHTVILHLTDHLATNAGRILGTDIF